MSLWEWLGMRRYGEWARVPWVGKFLGAVLTTLFILLCLGAVWNFGLFLRALVETGSFANDQTGAAIRNIGLVVVAFVGAPFLIWRAFVVQKQVNVAEQGMITDRISKAVEGLGSEKIIRELVETPRYRKNKDTGEWLYDKENNLIPALRPDKTPIVDRKTHELTSPNLEVRIGAIFSLERISQDSLRDHIQIMEILCAYVRGNAPAQSLTPSDDFSAAVKPREDIQTAITVLGRRSGEQIELEWTKKFRLNFRGCDLSGVNFSFGNFSAAQFTDCRIEGATFGNSVLEGTQFFNSLLNYTFFKDADLFGTRFDCATINQPVVLNNKSGGIMDANVNGIIVAGADLSSLVHLHENKNLQKMLGTRETKLHFYPEEFRIELLRMCEADKELLQTGSVESDNKFSHWLPYGFIPDDKRNQLYAKFLDKFGHNRWPHV
ncbi:MAG: pentapeptide repeat-containing protein [Hyphomicrobiales bacterium]